jgi:hypothetical protein
MRFDGRITPGDILVAVSIIISAFGVYNRLTNQLTNMKGQIEKLAVKMEPVYSWWDRHINNGESVREFREKFGGGKVE